MNLRKHLRMKSDGKLNKKGKNWGWMSPFIFKNIYFKIFHQQLFFSWLTFTEHIHIYSYKFWIHEDIQIQMKMGLVPSSLSKKVEELFCDNYQKNKTKQNYNNKIAWRDILRFWLFCQESSENIDISLIALGSIQILQMSFEGKTGSFGFSKVLQYRFRYM